MSPPSWTYLPSPSHPTLLPVTEALFEFPESYSEFPLAIDFTYGIINFYVTVSKHHPFSLFSSPSILFLKEKMEGFTKNCHQVKVTIKCYEMNTILSL